jgi:hypothetical protein
MAGWRRVPVEGGVMLVAPDAGAGVIRIRSRIPLRPFRVVLEEYARQGIGGAALDLSASPVSFATDEGEYAALFELASPPGDRRVACVVGLVVGDESMAIVDGRTVRDDARADLRERVEALTRSFCLGLGSDRWRRYFYTPPFGWQAIERPRAECWLAPGFPKNPGTITVFHARPELPSRPIAQHRRLFEDLTSEWGTPHEARPITTKNGLAGDTVMFQTTIDGERRRAANVGFADGRYVYFLRLETDEAHLEPNTNAFVQMLETVDALPTPRVDAAAAVHWSDE